MLFNFHYTIEVLFPFLGGCAAVFPAFVWAARRRHGTSQPSWFTEKPRAWTAGQARSTLNRCSAEPRPGKAC